MSVEDITDHGAVANPDDPGPDAARRNLDALHEAANAAGEGGTVYVPEGTFYYGHGGDGPNLLNAYGPREPAGISIVGDGAGKSVLAVTGHMPDDTNHSGFYWWGDTDHGDVEVRDVRLDGNYENLGSLVSNRTGARGCTIRDGARGTFTFANVHFRGWYTMGLWNKSVVGTVKRCTFEEIAIGAHEDSGGSFVSHGAGIDNLDSGDEFRFEKCLFTRIAGDAVNLDSGTGTVTLRRCYGESLGNGVHKMQFGGTARHEHCYWEPHTQWLVDNFPNPSDKPPFHGRNMMHRLSATGSSPTLSLNNVELRKTTFHAISQGDGNMSLEGDMIAFHDNGLVHRDHCISEDSNAPHTIDYSVDRISVHGTDGVVFECPDSSGSIGTLARANNSGLGKTGDVTIDADEQGGDPFAPDVPSRDEVGVDASTGSSSDGSQSVSWAQPTDGETVSGSVTAQVDASDADDDAGSLTVEYRVDGGDWTGTTYDADSGYYEASLDTTALADGDHTLEARATDSAGNTTSSAVGVVVANEVFAEWTPRWESSHDDWSVVNGSGYEGEYALAFEHDGSDRSRYAMSWDRVGEPSDVEVLDKFRVPNFTDDSNLGFHARVHLRSSVQNGAENGYWIEVEDPQDSFRLAKYTDGGLTTLKRFGTPEENTFFYRRFRATGDTLKAKIWRASESEPSSWDVEVTDTDHTDGWVGLGSYDTPLVETDVVSVATGGDTAPFAGSDTAPTVSWAQPTDGETVSGSVTAQVDASDADDDAGSLTVEYRVDGGDWTGTTYDADSGYYEASLDTTTLADGDHTLEARATDSAGNASTSSISVTTDNAVGPTVDSLSLSEVETNDSDAAFDAAWRVSDGDGDLDSVELTLVQDGGSSEDTATVGVSGDTASGTTRLVAGGDDGSGNSYTVELTATDGSGATATDTATASETEETNNSPPDVDRFSVSEADRPNPHAEVTVVWDVSDTDGDLSSVDIDVADSSGSVQGVTWSLNGATASDMDSFKIKEGDGKTFDVTLTVTDAHGASDSATKSVTA